MVKTSELRVKEIIDLRDGRRIGTVGDLEVDLQSGRVTALIVPAAGRLFSFFAKDRDHVIGWPQIRKIGQDVILVELQGQQAEK